VSANGRERLACNICLLVTPSLGRDSVTRGLRGKRRSNKWERKKEKERNCAAHERSERLELLYVERQGRSRSKARQAPKAKCKLQARVGVRLSLSKQFVKQRKPN
jgi:hypothetical protein